MQIKKILGVILVFSISVTAQAFARAPENLDTLKMELVKYHDSGEYAQDIAEVDSRALAYLKKRVERRTANEKLAIILDIDETSLSNYRDMVKLSFGGTFADIMVDEDKGTDAVIEPTLAIYQFAKSHGVAVFFVTGRTRNYRASTARNLERVGFKNFDGLTLKPEGYRESSVVPYKSSARKVIADAGYTIVLNIGDQESDLAGGFSEKTFKLPNPYYYIN
jgi:predicted secreted acid phosphatase